LNQLIDLLKARLGEISNHDVGAAFLKFARIAFSSDPNDEGEAPFCTSLDPGDRVFDYDRLLIRHLEISGRGGKNVRFRLSLQSAPGRFRAVHNRREEA